MTAFPTKLIQDSFNVLSFCVFYIQVKEDQSVVLVKDTYSGFETRPSSKT